MENRTINLAVVAEVANALQELKDQVVFVGGAVVSLYTDDPAADEIRPTGDIDITINLLRFNEWPATQERLAELGFHPDPFGHAICSYKYNNIPVDIMPPEDSPLGPSNRWYRLGFDTIQTVSIPEAVEIQIFAAPCYLATKFEAFNNRGTDYRTSHDFEDIINILDNRTTIVEEVGTAHPDIQEFIQQELAKIIENPNSEEIIAAHLHPLVESERYPILVEKINAIVGR